MVEVDRTVAEGLAEITQGLIRLHRQFYGKGPTKAHTYQVDDTVISILKGGFTTVERTLIDEDDAEAVHKIRRSFQEAMEEEFTAIVEGSTGRKVIAYMNSIHTDPDLAVELFVLEPGSTDLVGKHEAVPEEEGQERAE